MNNNNLPTPPSTDEEDQSENPILGYDKPALEAIQGILPLAELIFKQTESSKTLLQIIAYILHEVRGNIADSPRLLLNGKVDNFLSSICDRYVKPEP